MTLIRARQPIVTRVTPHNANRKYLVSRGKNFSPVPLPQRAPFEYEFRTQAAPNAANITLPFVLNIDAPGQFGFEVFNFTKPPSGILIAFWSPDFRLYLNGNILQAAFHGSIVNLETIPTNDYIFHNIVLEWSIIDASNMAWAYFRDGVEISNGTFPRGAITAVNMFVGSNAGSNPFFGVIRNVYFYSDVTGFIDGYFIDDNSGTIKHNGRGAGTDGTITARTSPSGWQEQSVDILTFTPNYPANILDYVYFDCALDQIYNNGLSTAGWSLSLNGVTNLPILSISPNNDRLRGVQLQTPHAVIPGTDYIILSYNKALAPAPPNSMNVPSFSVRINIL